MKSFKFQSRHRSKKFQHGFQPIYYFSRLIGLWPFTMIYISNGLIKETRINLFDSVWFLISISFYLTALFYACRKFDSDSSKIFDIWSLVYCIGQILALLFGAVGIALDMFNRNKLINILNKFIIFDNEVSVFL